MTDEENPHRKSYTVCEADPFREGGVTHWITATVGTKLAYKLWAKGETSMRMECEALEAMGYRHLETRTKK